MSDAPQRVTRKMFLEEYTRQLIRYSSVFSDVYILGKRLALMDKILNDTSTDPSDPKYSDWIARTEPARKTCESLGIRSPTIRKLRRLPKE